MALAVTAGSVGALLFGGPEPVPGMTGPSAGAAALVPWVAALGVVVLTIAPWILLLPLVAFGVVLLALTGSGAVIAALGTVMRRTRGVPDPAAGDTGLESLFTAADVREP